jgi:D-cysteine desulfhydrase
VITVGGLGSNQVVATAFHARAVGLTCEALLLPQPVTPLVVANLRAALALGARLIPATRGRNIPLALGQALLRLGRTSYVIGPGGSSALGTLGYVAAALELEQQVREHLCPEPSAIVVALGSGGTTAGLVAGLGQTQLATRVLAVRVVHPLLAPRARTLRLARRALRLLEHAGARVRPVDPERLEIIGDQLGAGYGSPTPAAAAAVARAAGEGLELETTYTGKALAGLIARAPHLRGPILFWNTFAAARLESLGPPLLPIPPALAAVIRLEASRVAP